MNKLSTDDRLAIDDLLTRYATAVDERNWDLLDTVFLPNAHLDYRSAGGVEGRYPEVRQWLADVLPIFEVMQHDVMNRVVRIHNAEVRATSNFLNVNVLEIDSAPWVFTVGGRYHDRLVGAGGEWKIAERIEETLWWEHPMPGLGARPPKIDGLLDSVPGS